MQLNTLIKLGSLAFDVAQNENVKELAGMVHKAGKRRGLWSQSPPNQKTKEPEKQGEKSGTAHLKAPETKKAKSQPVPFGPSWTEPPAWLKLPEAQDPAIPPSVGKYFSTGNAKRALKWAEDLGRIFMK